MIGRFIRRRVAALMERALDACFEKRTYETKGSPYLTRWFVWPRRAGDVPEAERGKVELYVHRFHRGDDDRHCHNHPFVASLALVLMGGYREERAELCPPGPPPRVRSWSWFRDLGAGSLNLIWADTYHRVTLLRPEEGSWSVFLAGPRVQPWGFLVNGSHVLKADYRRIYGGEDHE